MKLRELLRHPFVNDNLWSGFSSVLVNLLNYVYLLLALNFLTKKSFGAFTTLVSILTLATVVANPLLLQGAKEVSSLEGGNLHHYFLRGTKKIICFSGIGLLLLMAVSSPLASILDLTRGNLIFVWIVTTTLLLATFAGGVCTGLKKLKFQSLTNLSATVAKVLLGWLLFKFGLGLGAGLGGYLAGFALTGGATWFALRKWEVHRQNRAEGLDPGESFFVLILGYLFVAMPFSLDQVLVQILNHEASGDYAALATIGKLVFFASSPFQVVLYAYLVRVRHDKARLARYFFMGALVAVGAAAAFTALLWLGGSRLVGLLLTPAYVGVARWLPAYSLGMCGYVFSYAVVMLGIVRNDLRMVGLISLASLAQIGLFFVRHATLAHLVTNQVASLTVLSAAAIASLTLSPLRSMAPDR